jgi:hypothetical protein
MAINAASKINFMGQIENIKNGRQRKIACAIQISCRQIN